MEGADAWQKEREEWLKPTAAYANKDVYRREEISSDLEQDIKEIIESTKGPYPAFKKKMRLPDLLTIVQQVFDERDE